MTDNARYLPWAILLACGLLLVGVVLRSRVGLLRLLFIPAAVVGGRSNRADGLGKWDSRVFSGWNDSGMKVWKPPVTS